MKQITDRKAANIVASMRDQRLDVRLGIITPNEWVRRYDAGMAAGVTYPAALAAERERLSDQSGA